MKLDDLFGLLGIVLLGAIVAVMGYGWIMNIIYLATDAEFVPITGKVVISIIGVFVAPIGSIMGLFVW